MSHRPPTRLFLGMSKVVASEREIGISKSNFLLDGLYRDTFHFIFFGTRAAGKTIVTPSLTIVITGFETKSSAF